jgi:hypothetical protein
LYCSENGRAGSFFAEFFKHKDFFNEPRIKVCNGGLNLYRITPKLKRRILGFLDKGCDVYIVGYYINTKINKRI